MPDMGHSALVKKNTNILYPCEGYSMVLYPLRGNYPEEKGKNIATLAVSFSGKMCHTQRPTHILDQHSDIL